MSEASTPHSRELDIARRVLAQHPESEATEALLARAVLGLFEQLEAAQQEASDMRKAAAGMSADLTHFAQENAHLEEQLEAAQERLARLDAILALPSAEWHDALIASYPAKSPDDERSG